jgi:FAD-dependent urate hydroxylase
MNDPVDVAIIGAGPYGLSLAAHLRATKVRFRQFGSPMHLWRSSMPDGMFLKSQGFASNLSDPAGTHTLGAFCRSTGRTYGDYGVPVPLGTFTAYGQWFQQHNAPDIEDVLVTNLTRPNGHYELVLGDSELAYARNVVVAAGVEHFTHVPAQLSHLPRELCTHASSHADLGRFRGRDVVVIGSGQSALESAALLQENGASVRIVARAGHLVWNGSPLAWRRSLTERLREPEAGLGSGWSTWFYSTKPHLFRQLPAATRVRRARTALGPAGAWWLRARVDDQIPVLLGHTVVAAEQGGDHVLLKVRTLDGSELRLITEHVIAATGYRTSLDRLPFLDSRLRVQVTTLGGAPSVDRGFQSRVPGLYFAGPAVAPTFGPVMRFVYGADFAARVLCRRLGTGVTRSSTFLAGARR